MDLAFLLIVWSFAVAAVVGSSVLVTVVVVRPILDRYDAREEARRKHERDENREVLFRLLKHFKRDGVYMKLEGYSVQIPQHQRTAYHLNDSELTYRSLLEIFRTADAAR